MERLLIVIAATSGLLLVFAFVGMRWFRSLKPGLTIRMQIFIALSGIIGMFAVAMGIIVVERIDARAVRFTKQAAEAEAEIIAQLLSSNLNRSNHSDISLQNAFQGYSTNNAPSMIRLYSLDGSVLSESHARLKLGTSLQLVSADAPLIRNGKRIGYIRVEKTTQRVRAILADFAPMISVIALILAICAALAAYLLGKNIAEPIVKMNEYAQKIADGKSAILAPETGEARELRQLSGSLESMRRQLERRPFVEAFTADLSHELKNPVAAILASTEVLEDGALDEPSTARSFVRRIDEAARRIQVLVDELLQLARLNARGLDAVHLIDLSKLTEEAVAQLDSPARIIANIPTNISVRGDKLWLQRAIVNLLNNAMEHSDARVDISLKIDDVNAIIEVSNQGKVADSVKERIFRRFVTTRGDRGGTGLGLAIVRAVAESHGGEAELIEAGPPLVILRLRLPLGAAISG